VGDPVVLGEDPFGAVAAQDRADELDDAADLDRCVDLDGFIAGATRWMCPLDPPLVSARFDLEPANTPQLQDSLF
jgi:hypothetical protein